MNSPAQEETLECGTSLAEREYGREEEDSSSRPGKAGQQPPIAKMDAKEETTSVESLRSWIASDVLSSSLVTTFTSPFDDPAMSPGTTRKLQLPLVYCDQTASNRPVKSIERYMETVCLPLYGNTHTNTSITGSQTTAFVAEARQIVAEETNAKITGKASLDVVLFTGQGTTSAVELLVDCLGLRHACTDASSAKQRPVVFIGPYEHHSNLIPWRESGCEIVMVPECPKTNTVDIKQLDQLLSRPKYNNRLKMGTFTAASNVTGIVVDCDEIAACLHRHGALAFFDYATGAPYLTIDMNPPPSSEYPSASLVAKDAVFLSPHKMLGGVGTPGVLIVKKNLVSQSNAPGRSGGGTVFYVTNEHHRFLSNRIERYEGGTPNIPGIIRTGLTFLLKRKAEERYEEAVKRHLSGKEDLPIPKSIEQYDFATHQRISSYLRENAPNLVLLGSNPEPGSRPNLPIFSFLVRFGGRFLHYNYVCAILNDVFGIQSRGGCQCSGPYSQRLLGLTEMTNSGERPNTNNKEIEKALIEYKERAELLRPGYTRLSLPYKGLRSEEVEYVMRALEWVSKHAWALMWQYRCNHKTGEWRHHNRQGKPLGKAERRWLGHYDITSSGSTHDENTESSNRVLSDLLKAGLLRADAILQASLKDQRNIQQALKMSDAGDILGAGGSDKLEELRWYVYPKECAHALTKQNASATNARLVGAVIPVALANESSEPTSRPVTYLSGQVSSDTNGEDAAPIQTPDQEIPEKDGLLIFRDGNHMGEASLAEILDGIDDGELSEHCLVFDRQRDEWLQYHAITRSFAPNVAEEKKQDPTTKKATRDSSVWGSGDTVHPLAPKVDPNLLISTSVPSDQTLQSLKRKKSHRVKPPAKLMRLCTQAIIQWEMIKDGDRLLLGLSGGKDSLSLLHVLLEFQRKLPTKFEIEVCTIDPLTPSFDPSPLIPYVESLGLKYHYIRDDIVSRASTAGKKGKMVSSLCAYCARMKRGNLYACARKNNCNKLVLAQHLDDCAESFMMSLMHNGFLRTMKAHYTIDAGDLSVIRPFAYCRESLMTEFAKSANLPVINENCPACFEEPKERARVKKLLSREETLYPNFYDNIRRAILPLMHDDLSSILRSYTEDAVAKSRKEGKGKFKRQRIAGGDTHQNTSQVHSMVENEVATSLEGISDDALVMELARRKSERFRSLSTGTKENEIDDGHPNDPTGQVCSLRGGDGTIPCSELME